MSSNLDVGPFAGGNTAVFQNIGSGQTITAATDTILTINTEVVPKSFATSFGSNQATFADGRYYVEIFGSWDHTNSSNTNAVKVYMYDVSNTVEVGGATDIFLEVGGGPSAVPVNLKASFFTEDLTSSIFDFRIRSITTLSSVDAGGSISNYQLQVRVTKVG